MTCNRFKNPATGEYTLTNVEASHIFTALHRETQGVNNSKFNKLRQQVQKPKTVVETDRETITFYHEKNIAE